jgi:hypothetical protein
MRTPNQFTKPKMNPMVNIVIPMTQLATGVKMRTRSNTIALCPTTQDLSWFILSLLDKID